MARYALAAVVVFWLALVSANAVHGEGFHIEDANSVPEAVDGIRSTLERQGFDIVATIDHATGAASVGLELRPTTVIFAAQPLLESLLILAGQTVALDLPTKFLVYEDEDGEIQLNFNDEGFLVDRHRIPPQDILLRAFDVLSNQFGRLDNGIVTIESNQSVEETVNTLLGILQERDFRIPIADGIDFSARAQALGIELPPSKLVVFGNPNVGTPLMQNDQAIGLDLPQKFLIFESGEGRVFIAFNDPSFLARKHNLQRDVDPELETRLENISKALQGLAEASANP